VTAVNNTTRSF